MSPTKMFNCKQKDKYIREQQIKNSQFNHIFYRCVRHIAR